MKPNTTRKRCRQCGKVIPRSRLSEWNKARFDEQYPNNDGYAYGSQHEPVQRAYYCGLRCGYTEAMWLNIHKQN